MTALPDEELAASLVHWVLHGHQTMVSALQFILHFLATYQDHQQIVYAEICSQITTVSRDAFFKTFLTHFIFKYRRTCTHIIINNDNN